MSRVSESDTSLLASQVHSMSRLLDRYDFLANRATLNATAVSSRHQNGQSARPAIEQLRHDVKAMDGLLGQLLQELLQFDNDLNAATRYD